MADERRGNRLRIATTVAACLATVLTMVALVYPDGDRRSSELPNRIPEAAPYVVAEAEFAPPPFEEYWQNRNHPGQCQNCHRRIFDEWNGAMMANAWRDPAWRAAFLLSARQISSNGNCDTPSPPDGSERARHNPFAAPGDCVSRFDTGTGYHRMSRSGSLVDGMCSRCHMPTNYVDNVPLHAVAVDAATGYEHAGIDPDFNPAADNGTGLAFATLDAQHRNTESGKSGVSCMVCHTVADTRNTPFHNHPRTPAGAYTPALGVESRSRLLPASDQDTVSVPDPADPTLGYGVGGGAFRLSPNAIVASARLGPLLSPQRHGQPDIYLAGVFKRPVTLEPIASPQHDSYGHVLTARAEFCSTCHDVTNMLTLKNRLGKWVGGFPIERTYAEWAGSRYAERPGNRNFDPAFKRDCQTCHMQQDYGQPGTAQTLYKNGSPVSPLTGRLALDGPSRTYFSHHFVGGNAYIPRLVGTALDEIGSVQAYPELSTFSFSSADPRSVYANAYWMNADRRGTLSQHARLAWDRLRHVVDLDLTGPDRAAAGTSAPIAITVSNTGAGHNFPTGFPEGRIAWVAVSAYDLPSGHELPIYDAAWKRTSIGVGRLTTAESLDPEFPGCDWKTPAGSPDPYAYQFKAVATLGDNCPTLELIYATPRNLLTNANGQPIDARGVIIDKDNPGGRPIFRDLNGNGDLYDDAFLRDTRLRPMPHGGATATLDRYSIVIPPGTSGPIAVSAAVYYQSLEAVVAKKFLGNLADTDTDFVLEPCVLGGACDGRRPAVEPAVVEGAPPVPMAVRNWVIRVEGGATALPAPRVIATYPSPDSHDVFQDVVPKASFSVPVIGVDATTFTLRDESGALVPASVQQVGDGTWALFPDQVFLRAGRTYTARIDPGVCALTGSCAAKPVTWRFTLAATGREGTGDTTIPPGFPAGHKPTSSPR